MSSNSTGTDVFEDANPDPDAVLAEFGVESPDDLLEAGGAHDPVADEMDVDDTTAASSSPAIRTGRSPSTPSPRMSRNPSVPTPTPTRITNDAFRSVDADMR